MKRSHLRPYGGRLYGGRPYGVAVKKISIVPVGEEDDSLVLLCAMKGCGLIGADDVGEGGNS